MLFQYRHAVRVTALALAGALGVSCGSSSSKNTTATNATGSGSGSMAVLQIGGETYAFVPSLTGMSRVKLTSGGTVGALTASAGAGRAAAVAALTPPVQLTLTPVPDACGADWNGNVVACISYSSSKVHVIDSSGTLLHTYDTGLTASASFSGGSCVLCGVLYDPTDDRMILATAGGYALFDHKGSGTIVRTIPTLVAENFGYNPVTNQIFSPRYGNGASPSIDLVDVATSKVYSLTPPPSTLDSPDHGAVDYSTNIGITGEEFNVAMEAYLVNLGSAALDKPAAKQFQAPLATIPMTHTTTCSWPITDIAVDSTSHVAFFSAEFCSGSSGDAMGAAKMPTSATATLTLSDYVFSSIPNPPAGTWSNPGDPHGIANFTVSSGSKHYGLLVNDSKTYVAAVDLDLLLAAKRSAGDVHLVDSTVDLIATKVVTFFPL
jgi:hypothetical protein